MQRCSLNMKKGSLTLKQSSTRPSLQRVTRRKPKVLVVEDEALVALQIEDALQEAGFDVLGPARSSAEALDLLKSSPCDAAVLDIGLGSETSEPVARALIARDIPFITLSGYS